MTGKLIGLVAATHTPFDTHGQLSLAAVEKQAEHLLRTGVNAVFIGGSTGECHSLTVEERRALAERWSEVVRGSSLRLVVHVGSNCLADARALASQAQARGAAAIAALAPSYFNLIMQATRGAGDREIFVHPLPERAALARNA